MEGPKIKRLDKPTEAKLMKMFLGERKGFVAAGEKEYIMPAQYADHAAAYMNMPLRSDDVWIVTYPRTGTTVTQELIWMINYNFDFETSYKDDLIKRFPFLEFSSLMHPEVIAHARKLNENSPEAQEYFDYLTTPSYKVLESMKSPRHIKTHLPLSLLPPKLIDTCKVIYNARNPKDVVESYFHHNQLICFHDYQGTFEDYYDLFEKDLLLWSPFWDHVKEGWDLRHHKNVLFLFYEDIIKDTRGTIKKVAEFLEKPITEEQVGKLADHLEINNFREKVRFFTLYPGIVKGEDPLNKFIRKGKSGSNELFTDELNSRANKWISENEAKIGIKFPLPKKKK